MNRVTVIKSREDGTFLGADEDGNLYNGRTTYHGFEEMVRTIMSRDGKTVEFEDRLGDTVISHGVVPDDEHFVDDERPHDPVEVHTYDERGQQTGTIEKKIAVVTWERKK